MNLPTTFKWTSYYEELATKLLSYKTDRRALIQKITDAYKTIGFKLPTLEKDNKLTDIDPFSLYALFNKGIKNENRSTIMKGLASEFGINAEIPTSFEGVPTVNNLAATFYAFEGDRGDNDIENLWTVFELALKYADDSNAENEAALAAAYDVVRKQKNVKWNITMGLYWIRPYIFFSLDSRNRWYIDNPDNMPANFVAKVHPMIKDVPSGEDYFKIIRLCKDVLKSGEYEFTSYVELSYKAWLVSEEDNKREKGEKSGNGVSNAAHTRWAKPIIIALRELNGSGKPQDVRDKIIKNEKLTQEEVSVTRGKTNVNKFENEVAFARVDLVNGGYIDNSVHGIWTLTDKGWHCELNEDFGSTLFKNTVEQINNKKNDNNAISDNAASVVRYWLYAPGEGAKKWEEFYKKGIIAIGWGEIGDLNAFESKEEMKERMKEVLGDDATYMNSAHATWQFANEMKPGDIVYAKKGVSQVVGRGVVTGDYEYDDQMEDHYNNVRKINWTNKGEWPHPGKAVTKTLTDISPYTDYVDKLKALFINDEEDEEEIETVVHFDSYSKEQFLEEVYMPENEYDDLVALLNVKKNIILQGAPGVGKTFAAKRLAYSIMEEKNIKRVMMVQFHQSYSYEDFIEGFRPVEKGFELKKGAFYNFCKDAEIDSDNPYFFIIDEINRGNLSKIFGELFMLIESDKRGIELQLLYSNEKFSVPKNVHIIGMMNTADRSLALLDYALRRRFAFVEMKPGFDTDGFKAYQASLGNSKFDKLISEVKELNTKIKEDETLGEGFCIGHSYFCNLVPETMSDQKLRSIVEFELIPLLKEYWFDEPSNIRTWSDRLRSAIK